MVVGRARSGLAPAIRDYEQRIRRYWRLEVIEVRQARGRTPGLVLRREAPRIVSRMDPDLVWVALTRRGRAQSSVDMAGWMEDHMVSGRRGVCFVIGGAFGLEADLLGCCAEKWSLSPFTLPHDIARLLLAEQLYRSGSILRNEPYHKGPT